MVLMPAGSLVCSLWPALCVHAVPPPGRCSGRGGAGSCLSTAAAGKPCWCASSTQRLQPAVDYRAFELHGSRATSLCVHWQGDFCWVCLQGQRSSLAMAGGSRACGFGHAAWRNCCAWHPGNLGGSWRALVALTAAAEGGCHCSAASEPGGAPHQWRLRAVVSLSYQ